MVLRQKYFIFIPLGFWGEIQKVNLKNTSTKSKNLNCFHTYEWCFMECRKTIWTNFQRNFSTGEVEIEDSVIYHKTELENEEIIMHFIL